MIAQHHLSSAELVLARELAAESGGTIVIVESLGQVSIFTLTPMAYIHLTGRLVNRRAAALRLGDAFAASTLPEAREEVPHAG